MSQVSEAANTVTAKTICERITPPAHSSMLNGNLAVSARVVARYGGAILTKREWFTKQESPVRWLARPRGGDGLNGNGLSWVTER